MSTPLNSGHRMKRKIKQIIRGITPAPIINYRHSLRRRNYLKKSESSVSTSQVGQDYWVYGEVFNEKEGGFFLDIGAYNGVFLSNTFILEKRYHWNGICVEANPKAFIDLKASRNCKLINKCIDKKSGLVDFAIDGLISGIVALDCDHNGKDREVVSVEAMPLKQLLQEEKAPAVIDYLSIDIEGAEDRALLEFEFDEYTFNCITIERPSVELKGILIKKGYILIKEIPGLDCFYIHTSFKDKYWNNFLRFSQKAFLTKRWR